MINDDFPIIRPGSDPSDVVRAWADLLLFVDREGLVVEASGTMPGAVSAELKVDALKAGEPCWRSLPLGAESMEALLRRYPPGTVHEVQSASGPAFILRVLPLPESMAPKGGYALLATDNQPMESLYGTMEERLEDNITAWSDSITLFNSLFDAAKDATLLLTMQGSIVAANPAATEQHAAKGVSLVGAPAGDLFGRRFRVSFGHALDVLPDGGEWMENVTALDGERESFPAEATLKRVRFSSYVLFQLVLRDLSPEAELRRSLREKNKEVEQMNVTLKQVLRSVEEDRQELRSEVMSEIKKQLLPALERIARESTPEVRESYRTVIEDRLVDLAGDAGMDDAELLRLSQREMEVCRLVQIGRSGKEIAELLNLSFETVQTHRKNIRRKLGIKGQTMTLARYLRGKPSLT